MKGTDDVDVCFSGVGHFDVWVELQGMLECVGDNRGGGENGGVEVKVGVDLIDSNGVSFQRTPLTHKKKR